MGMVCTGTPPNVVCTWVDDEPSNTGNGNGSTQQPSNGGQQNQPTGGSVMDYDTGNGETKTPIVTTVPANSPSPAGALTIPNYNMNIFIGIAIIVASLGVGYVVGKKWK